MTSTINTIRSTDLGSLVAVLRDQQARKHDVVVSAKALRATVIGGVLTVGIPEPEAITLEGVGANHPATISTLALGQLAEKTGIPSAYLRTMAETPDHRELAADNLNHWFDRDERSFLLRSFLGDDGSYAYLRSVLSNGYGRTDHLDAIMAALEGLRAAGVRPSITKCDLTERNLYVRFEAPEIAIAVADLVEDYKHLGRTGMDYPMLSAGLVLANSETGGGAFVVSPRPVFQVCSNGMTRESDGFRRIHVGSKMEDGIVWSEDTVTKEVELITAKTRDVVKAVMSREYLAKFADDLRAFKGLKVTEPIKVVQTLSKNLKWTVEQTDALLAAFIGGGDLSVLGLGQAVTSLAQGALDGDAQHEAETGAFNVMAMAARIAG